MGCRVQVGGDTVWTLGQWWQSTQHVAWCRAQSKPLEFVLLVPVLITINILITSDAGRTPPVPKLRDQQADLVPLVYRGPGS